MGHPEQTIGLQCNTVSSDSAIKAAWSDPWPIAADASTDGCYLYTATAKDTISGMAEHFGVDVLQLLQNNTRRGVIPTELRGDPPRPEPQLGGPWAGKQFQLCGLPDDAFGRVVQGAYQGCALPALLTCCHTCMQLVPAAFVPLQPLIAAALALCFVHRPLRRAWLLQQLRRLALLQLQCRRLPSRTVHLQAWLERPEVRDA